MKTIIVCILTLSIGIVAKAQSTTASLNITITDVQSVKFDGSSLGEAVPVNEEIAKNGTLQVLSRSTSQIRKINSKTSEYARLYKEIYSDTAVNASSSANPNVNRVAMNRTNPKGLGPQNNSNLVIYQVDPR